MNSLEIRRLILLVEDDPTHQVLARTMLEPMSYMVHTAASGQRALEAVSLETYDLIFMDCQMPGMSGFETTQLIRERERKLSLPQIPVIATTGTSTVEIYQKCINSGMNDFLAKPFTGESLQKIISKWLDLSSGRVTWSRLDELRAQVSPSTLNEVIHSFESSLSAAVTDFANFYEQKDWDQMAKLAHRLKTSSLALGAQYLARLCADTEATVESGTQPTARSMQELIKNCKLTLREFQNRSQT